MDLQDYLRVVRKRWRIIVGVTCLTLLAAAALTILTPRTYQSKAQLFISTASSETSVELAQGSSFTQKQMKTYTNVITSPKVLDPVHDTLGMDRDAPLAGAIAASAPVDTVLLDLAVTDRDSAHAARVANAIAEEFTSTIQELQSVKTGQESPVKATIVRPAAQTTSPVAPRPLRNLGLAFGVGLLLGLGLALLRDLLDTSIKGERDVKEVTDETIIGGIHFDPDAKTHPLIVQGDPQSTRAEAFRTLRTNLQFVDAANHPKVLVFTSSLPGEGKSTTTANLALTMGASGAHVCVIEGDLRRPQLLQYMGLEGGVGLTTVLIGDAELDDVLQPFGHNVHVLGAGPIPPNPSELLGSDPMRAVLDELRQRFDYVIIDAPPVLPVTDAAVVSRLADGAVMIVGSGVIKKEDLARALDTLETVGARVLGLVMNRVPTKGADGYSYYGERYAYRSSEPAGPVERTPTGSGAHRESTPV